MLLLASWVKALPVTNRFGCEKGGIQDAEEGDEVSY